MDIEIGKWYKDPKGPAYRINFATKHPILNSFYVEVEVVKGIYDYNKRSLSTRYEVTERFYQFYMDLKDNTSQEIINNAYINGLLLEEAQTDLIFALDHKEKSDAQGDNNMLLKNFDDKFKFKTTINQYKEVDVETLYKKLGIESNIELEIINPY